jgi:hypothetical protein
LNHLEYWNLCHFLKSQGLWFDSRLLDSFEICLLENDQFVVLNILDYLLYHSLKLVVLVMYSCVIKIEFPTTSLDSSLRSINLF